MQELSQEISQAQDTLKSLELEIQLHGLARKKELEELISARKALEVEEAQLNIVKTRLEKENADNKITLENIAKAHSEHSAIIDDLMKARNDAEDRRIAAIADINSATYCQEIANNLRIVFRQALSSYIAYAGTEIKIPELTDEHKRWIAQDLLKQCGDLPVSLEKVKEEESKPQGDPLESVLASNIDKTHTIEELRELYKEKFGKKPFLGWKESVLISKLS